MASLTGSDRRKVLGTGVIGLLALVALGGWLLPRSASVIDSGPDMPDTDECLALVDHEIPNLQTEAARLLSPEDHATLSAADECEYGGYPSVQGVASSVATVESRMKGLGTVQRVENTECLKYLEPTSCNALWHYRPRSGDHAFVVEMDTNSTSGGSEFAIAIDHEA